MDKIEQKMPKMQELDKKWKKLDKTDKIDKKWQKILIRQDKQKSKMDKIWIGQKQTKI